MARSEDELRQKEEELNSLRERLLKEDQTRKEMDEQQTALLTEKNELFIQLQQVCAIVASVQVCAYCCVVLYTTVVLL